MRDFGLIGLLVGTLFMTSCVIDNPSGSEIALPVHDSFCSKGSFEYETGTITTTINYYTENPVSKIFFECVTEESLGTVLDGVVDVHSGRMSEMSGGWTVTFTTCELPVYGMSGPLEYWQHVDISDNTGILASGDEYTGLNSCSTVYRVQLKNVGSFKVQQICEVA